VLPLLLLYGLVLAVLLPLGTRGLAAQRLRSDRSMLSQ